MPPAEHSFLVSLCVCLSSLRRAKAVLLVSDCLLLRRASLPSAHRPLCSTTAPASGYHPTAEQRNSPHPCQPSGQHVDVLRAKPQPQARYPLGPRPSSASKSAQPRPPCLRSTQQHLPTTGLHLPQQDYMHPRTCHPSQSRAAPDTKLQSTLATDVAPNHDSTSKRHPASKCLPRFLHVTASTPDCAVHSRGLTLLHQ